MKELLEEIARLREREQRLIEITGMLVDQSDLDDLLKKVVSSLRSVTTSDAGSLYLTEGDMLRFAVTENASKEIPFSTFTIPISSSTLAGYVAQTGETLRFDDVYTIDPELPYTFSSNFDVRFGYRTKSMLVVPLINRAHKVVGVLQLINKKRNKNAVIDGKEAAELHVIPYTDDDVDFLTILACEAGLAIERAELYTGIERLFRGTIEASAAAIQSRDKTTAGHSQRIAGYTVALARRINKVTEGFWKEINFSEVQIRELFYSAMLHDIGKIGVREHVLIKANKLTNQQMESIHARIGMQKVRNPEKQAEWQEIWDFLKKVNIPGFLNDGDFARLQELARIPILDADGNDRFLLSEDEFENLSVRRGNLTASERKEIESHVTHSVEILNQIPWTEDLKRVPMIAGTHHEKLNGTGYPKGLKKDEIPFEGRMLAVVDIFEALTAMDRPYKPAMPIAKALEILKADAKSGSLQEEIVDFFIDHKVYEVISDDQRRNFTMTSDELLALE